MLKTMLAVTMFVALMLLPQFAPTLKSYSSFDPHTIPSVWDLPVPKPPASETEPVLDLRDRHLKPMTPHNLSDARRDLDRFYAALLKGGTVRILHYGDSPTTGDLITADARALFQQQFGDAGAGFVLIAKPWAWYYHRGVDMDSSHWTIEVAGATEVKDGLHGLGGVSFVGTPGATST
ncbi:MAG TPA: hypothetical protein VGJ09_01555, partial [Bryobacteraceae bacterium]